MVTPAVRQKGVSLLELMLSAAIGVLILGMIGAVFLSSQKLAMAHRQHLVLQQALSLTMRQIKQDIQRAGYDIEQGKPVTLQGEAQPVVWQAEPPLLAYVYRDDSDGSEPYRNLVYWFDESSHQLKLCEKTSAEPLSVEQAAQSGSGGVCYSMFDANVVHVELFTVTSDTVGSAQAQSTLLSMTVRAALAANSTVSEQESITWVARNG